MSRERVIVDGYNLLHAHPAYRDRLAEDLDSARARLVADLAGYAQGGPRTVVVFDGASNPRSDGVPHHVGSLTVVFSPAGVSADTVIERLAARSRERGEATLVVTSDGATRSTVRGGSVAIRSSEAFAEELAAESAGRLADGAVGGRRAPLAQRIDSDVSGILARWARGSAPGGRTVD